MPDQGGGRSLQGFRVLSSPRTALLGHLLSKESGLWVVGKDARGAASPRGSLVQPPRRAGMRSPGSEEGSSGEGGRAAQHHPSLRRLPAAEQTPSRKGLISMETSCSGAGLGLPSPAGHNHSLTWRYRSKPACLTPPTPRRGSQGWRGASAPQTQLWPGEQIPARKRGDLPFD